MSKETLYNKLNTIYNSKQNIKQALINKGQTVTEDFTTYANIVESMNIIPNKTYLDDTNISNYGIVQTDYQNKLGIYNVCEYIDTSNVTNFAYFTSRYLDDTNIDSIFINTDNMVNGFNAFDSAYSNIKHVTVTNIDKLSDGSNVFRETQLVSIKGNGVTSNLTDAGHMFYGVRNIIGNTVNNGTWDTSGITNAAYMFYNTGFNTNMDTLNLPNCNNFYYMFAYSNVYMTNNAIMTNYGNITDNIDYASMFRNSNIKTSMGMQIYDKTYNAYGMFASSNVKGYNTSMGTMDIQNCNITNAYQMMSGVNFAGSLSINNCNITNIQEAFQGVSTSTYGFRVTNCNIMDSNLGNEALVSGGSSLGHVYMNDTTFSNITISGASSIFYLNTGDNVFIGGVSNVNMCNVTGTATNGIFMQKGLHKNLLIEDINMCNITLTNGMVANSDVSFKEVYIRNIDMSKATNMPLFINRSYTPILALGTFEVNNCNFDSASSMYNVFHNITSYYFNFRNVHLNNCSNFANTFHNTKFTYLRTENIFINSSIITNTSGMFYGTTITFVGDGITIMNTRQWSLPNCTDISSMFQNYYTGSSGITYQLTNLYNCLNASRCFANIFNLAGYINIDGLTNCTNALNMFYTTNVTNVIFTNYNYINIATNMFSTCKARDIKGDGNMLYVTKAAYMFSQCTVTNIVNMPITINGDSCINMFYWASNMVNAPNIDFSGTKAMNMFYGDTNLVRINYINVYNLQNAYQMFCNCTNLKYINSYDFGSMITDTSRMFNNCRSIESAPQFDTSNVINMVSMFEDCISLKDAPQYNTSNVTNMRTMFYGCNNLQNIPQYDTINVTNMGWMFSECNNLQNIPQLDTSNVTNMCYMFYRCRNLENATQFNTINVTNMASMFDDCQNLQNIPQFDTSNVINMASMFRTCYNLQNIPQFDTSNVTDMTNMFLSCRNLHDASVQNIINMVLNSNITNTTLMNLSNTNSYSPLYQTVFNNTYYQDRWAELDAAGWKY